MARSRTRVAVKRSETFTAQTLSAAPARRAPTPGLASDTQFKRAIAGAYRNSIVKEVSEKLHAVVLGWLEPCDRDSPYLALNLDAANYNKWLKEGALSLRMLTQILVQQSKDFTDLYLENDIKILGPDRAEDLKLIGSQAALREGYRRLHGDEAALSVQQALALLVLYRYKVERNDARLTCAWVHDALSSRSARERNDAEWILENVGQNDLAVLVDSWAEVCVQVCQVLEEHVGLD